MVAEFSITHIHSFFQLSSGRAIEGMCGGPLLGNTILILVHRGTPFRIVQIFGSVLRGRMDLKS